MSEVGTMSLDRPDVSIILPCLNEAVCLPACLANAREALAMMRTTYGLNGEIVVADNGSTDGSPAIAEKLGARCIHVTRRGYGAALVGGSAAAYGRFLVMGDADGSYDFRDAVAMVGKLMQGADLCMGSRFKGGIEPGAMPWKNRYIGNPILTGILNVLFRAGISDAHCGLRAFTRTCFDRLQLSGEGMEFASEMVIKAALLGCTIAEQPATLSRDLRDRPPHLRPWRDGWRHLRYLLMLSPTWLFAAPAVMAAGLALGILALAGVGALQGSSAYVGNYWIILAGGLLTVAHSAAVLAAAGNLYGVREGYRRRSDWSKAFARWGSLEVMLIAGAVCVLVGGSILAGVLSYWSSHRFVPLLNVLPAVLGTSLLVIGGQNILGGFLIAIVNGNDADFVRPAPVPAASGSASRSASLIANEVV
ncbi:MAG TPA: glycosyltransferase family 2 protein [Hyphomicrobiaceae bacterium]|nr:glycosyltransferase family 2 protein [Hyphomicrobiaceae bacterium]